MTIPKLALAACIATLMLAPTSAFARHHHPSHSGACDGFNRCRCGTTAARLHGLPYNYQGLNLKMAREWYHFPHTGFGVGAVAVYPHHVATIVGGSSCHSATVSDDAGTYERNVCGATFVSIGSPALDANGNTVGRTRIAHRSRSHERYAVADSPAAPDVALGVH